MGWKKYQLWCHLKDGTQIHHDNLDEREAKQFAERSVTEGVFCLANRSGQRVYYPCSMIERVVMERMT